MTSRRSVIVVGGGIAGIAAALRLAESGVAVTLLETRKKLGGRATSFVDVRTGQTLDNCQHVALGCCTNYLDLLGRLGVADKIRWDHEQYWVERGGRTSTIRPGPLPAPAHFGLSVLAAHFLSVGEKLKLALAMRAIMRADRSKWGARTFADFLTQHGQPRTLIDKFWAPVVVSACNLTCDRASAASALHVFQDGFCATRTSAAIGIATVPLLELYDRAEEVITRAGGIIRLGASVDRLDATSATTGGETLTAEQVICALPPERATEVIASELQTSEPRFAALDRITHSPILGVHLVFDRPVLPLPHAVLVEGATQWLFRKDAEGRAVHAVISAADEWMPLDEAEIGRRVLADLHAFFPASREAQPVSIRPVKERRATFAGTPEVEPLRPTATGPSGLILAGDYTAVGWPATMEGATRSGYIAAAAALGRTPQEFLLPDLRKASLARVMGLRDGPLPGSVTEFKLQRPAAAFT